MNLREEIDKWVQPLSPFHLGIHHGTRIFCTAPACPKFWSLGSAPRGSLQLSSCALTGGSSVDLSGLGFSICRVVVPAHLSSAFKSTFY